MLQVVTSMYSYWKYRIHPSVRQMFPGSKQTNKANACIPDIADHKAGSICQWCKIYSHWVDHAVVKIEIAYFVQ